ncbi:MAG: tyrosine-type recombinase/integrase [Alphaproteobacteria bacterium]|nr:tyrosine-type recombinase/integrase [Alphaproteobacteria bacterium]
MNYQQIRDFLTFVFKEKLAIARHHIEQNGRFSDQQKRAFHHMQLAAEDAIKYEHYLMAGTDQEITGLIEGHELPIESGSKEYEMLRAEYLIYQTQYVKRALDIDESYSNYDLSDTEVGKIKPHEVKPAKKKTKLAEVIKAYIEDKDRLGSWNLSSKTDYESKFNLLLEYLGNDADADISSEIALDVKNMLIQLPKDRTKKSTLKDLNIHEQIKTDAKLYPRLSASSVNQHLSAYSSLYEWLLNRDQATKNPYKMLLDNVNKKRIKREGFTQEQIDLIIPIAMKAKLHLKWGTLIGFYSGARLNEIAQLDVIDIIEIAGVPCFNITNEEDPANKDTLRKKKLKNEPSKRIVPIHSKLIELGLLEHVKARKADSSPETKLFIGMGYDKKNGFGRNLGRWFRESVLDKQLGIKTKERVFHSIRHTVARKLRNAEVMIEDVANILGHSHTSVTAGVYAPELLIPLLKERIERLDYGNMVSQSVAPHVEEADPLALHFDD